VVVGGVQGVTNEPCSKPYDDIATILTAAILKSCSDESQSACSVSHDALLTGLGRKVGGVIVRALPRSDRSICEVTGQAYLDLGFLRGQSAPDLRKQCLVLAPR
jgi:hypothetical protein